MKTLAIDCRMAQMSGIGVYIRNVVPRCMLRMQDVNFVLLGYDNSFETPADSSWQKVNFASPIYGISEQIYFNSVLKGCNAVWLPHYNIPLFCKKPMAVTVHDTAHLALKDTFSPSKRIYAQLVFNTLRRKASEIFVISQFTKHEFERLVGKPKGRCTVVYNGVDELWQNKPVHSQSRGKEYFLAVGNVKPHKNIPFLCRAFAKIANKCTLDLIIAGEQHGFRSKEISPEQLMALSPGRIHFTGKIPDQQLVELTTGAKALVFPSLYEGFGLPPLEAMFCKVPVIASDIPPVKEVCAEHALYFDPLKEEQLSQRLLDLTYMDAAKTNSLVEAAHIHAQNFSWEKTADAVVEGLRRLL